MNNIIYTSEFFRECKSFYNQLTNHTNNQIHTHEFFEIFYVTAGNAQQTLNNKTTDISVGDCYILRPTDFHCFKSKTEVFCHRDFAITQETFEAIGNFLNPPLCKQIITAPIPMHFTLSLQNIANLESLFNQTNLESDILAKETLYKIILLQIFTILIENQYQKANITSTMWLNTLISDLSAPYNLSTPIQNILSKYPYNRAYISRAFKKKTGKTPIEYFNDLRLQHAYAQIQTNTTSITNIARSVGFHHRSFFYKIFKQKYGITPTELKNNLSIK